METSLLKTLADKHRSSVTKMARKHKAAIDTPHGPRKCLEARVERNGRKPLVARFGGIPLRRQKDAVITDRVPVPGVIRHKELVIRLLADRCELCGDAGHVDVHHVRKLADLGKPGQPQPAWAEQMATRRRKTLVVCPSCHDTIHAGSQHRCSRSNYQRAACGESRMRRSGWGPPEKDPHCGHLAGGPPALCGTTWPRRSSEPPPATGPACKTRSRPRTGPPAAGRAAPEAGLPARTRIRHAEVHAALARGLTLTEVSRTLRLDRKTVRRYATAATADQLTGGPRLTQPGLLGPHQAYLRQRWDEGIRSTEQLHAELRDRGYRGSLRTLRRPTARLRRNTAVPAPPPAPAAKKVASWILTPPGDLTDDDRAALAQITARCAELKATRDLVREFADMLCNRRGERLETWASQAEASPVSELRGFAKGLRNDWAAVTAGLTVPYSSGAVEGHVNRIKMIKRQMYGRAKPDLLRKRVLLAD